MYLLWNCPQMNVAGPYWWQVNIGSGNAFAAVGQQASISTWASGDLDLCRHMALLIYFKH